MTRAGGAGRARGRGQALVETLAALLVLVPLWLAVVYVPRWHDLQHATIAAARHAAFESWVSAGGDDAAIAATTQRRIFGDHPARIGAGAPAPAPAPRLARWSDHRGVSLVGAPGADVVVGRGVQPARVAQAERLAFDIIAPARAVGRPAFDLQRDAARGATVTVPVVHDAGLPEPFDGLRFTLVERLELLVDPWASRGPREVSRRTDALSPSVALRELARPLEPVRWAVSLFEPAFERLCLGRVEPDVVPPDRLRGANGPALDLRTRPC